MDAAMSHSPVSVKLTDSLLQIPGKFSTPTFGAAIYHQSVFKDLFGADGLSATVGIRLDYEKVKIDYDSRAAMNYNMLMRGSVIKSGAYAARYFGNLDNQYFPILPKFSIDYRFNGANNVYAQVSRGYRSGGYNIQMLSDYLQSAMMLNKGDIQNDSSVNLAIKYKPEYSWNYEAGAHLTIPGTEINVDVAAFYMRVKNQQVARFVESGLGRYTTNAGKSRSCGAEFSAHGQIIDNLSFAVNYGYTHATFIKYLSNEKVYDNTGKAALQVVDYKGKHVPFAPENTFSAALMYDIPLGNVATSYSGISVKGLRAEIEYSGAGRTFFTEANDVSQKFYGLLNARIVARLSRLIEIDIWGRNLLNKDYAVFYFDSSSAAAVNGSTGFMQKGKSIQGGIDLRIRF
jgi:outer membrane receptor protein involved in Fe transport